MDSAYKCTQNQLNLVYPEKCLKFIIPNGSLEIWYVAPFYEWSPIGRKPAGLSKRVKQKSKVSKMDIHILASNTDVPILISLQPCDWKPNLFDFISFFAWSWMKPKIVNFEKMITLITLIALITFLQLQFWELSVLSKLARFLIKTQNDNYV